MDIVAPLSSIIEYLANDTSSRTAADVLTANPGKFSSILKVPDYSWQSLSTLLTGSDQASSVLLDHLNYRIGEVNYNADGEVTLLYGPESATNYDFGIPSNLAGAETSYMDVEIRLPEGSTVKKMQQTDLRIRYLLDYFWRTKRVQVLRALGEGPYVPRMSDENIDGAIFCVFKGALTPLNSKEFVSRYITSFDFYACK